VGGGVVVGGGLLNIKYFDFLYNFV